MTNYFNIEFSFFIIETNFILFSVVFIYIYIWNNISTELSLSFWKKKYWAKGQVISKACIMVTGSEAYRWWEKSTHLAQSTQDKTQFHTEFKCQIFCDVKNIKQFLWRIKVNNREYLMIALNYSEILWIFYHYSDID